MGVCFEIRLDTPCFPEKETVSWLLQTPTPNYSIYLRGGSNSTQARFVPGRRGGVTGLFNTIVLETELQVQASTTSLALSSISNKKMIFFFFSQLVSSLCHDLKVMESFTWNDKERYIYFIIWSG